MRTTLAVAMVVLGETVASGQTWTAQERLFAIKSGAFPLSASDVRFLERESARALRAYSDVLEEGVLVTRSFRLSMDAVDAGAGGQGASVVRLRVPSLGCPGRATEVEMRQPAPQVARTRAAC